MKTDIIDILKSTNAIITDDHFVYTSGKHGSVYINKDAIYPHTELSSQVGKLFADRAKDLNIDVVIAPALGGIVLSQWTAYHLSKIKNKDILGIYTEKDSNGDQLLKRGYDKLIAGKDVLVIEDLTNTGGSVAKVVNAVKNAGANVVSVGVMVNRKPEEVNEKMFGLPFFSLGVLEADAYDENDCPFCQQNVPVNSSVGHGKKFLNSHRQ